MKLKHWKANTQKEDGKIRQIFRRHLWDGQMMTEGVVFMGERMFSIMANPGNLHLYMSYDENRYFRVSGGSR